MRIAVLVFAICVCSYAIALKGTPIYEMVSGAYQVTLVGAFVPLVAGLFWSRATTQGAVFAIVLGLVTWGLMLLAGLSQVFPPQLAGFVMAAIGMVIGGRQGMMIAFAIAIAMNFFSYWFSDKMVLKVYKAQEVDETTAPQFYNMVKELAGNAGLPMPRVYLINEDAPNAFATGRDPRHASVAATSGLLSKLDREELTGVIGHELSK